MNIYIFYVNTGYHLVVKATDESQARNFLQQFVNKHGGESWRLVIQLPLDTDPGPLGAFQA